MSILRIVLLLFISSITVSGFSQVPNQSNNVAACISTANAHDAPFMVYVYAAWCLPCQVMEDGTFQDHRLVTVLDYQVDFYKIDYNSEIGEEWRSEFAIACLPTTLYFDSNGQLLDRIESSYTATECLDVLAALSMIESVEPNLSSAHKIRGDSSEKLSEGSSKEEQIILSISSIKELLSMQKLSSVVETELMKSLYLLQGELERSKVEPTNDSVSLASQSNMELEKEISRNNVHQPEMPDRFVVQLGVFSSEKNAMTLSSEVSMKTNHPTIVLQEWDGAQQLYRVVSQPYGDRAHANYVSSLVQEAGFSTFVKSM